MMRFEIRRYEEIDSTNTEARRLMRDGLVVVAERQSAGKGRRGRSWLSSDTGNLYFSLLLKPEIVPEKAPMLTLVMAYSVARAILRLTKGAQIASEPLDATHTDDGFVKIKWPNDLVIAGKKVCGILTEMHLSQSACGEREAEHMQAETPQIEDVVIGVGINVNGGTFPEELEDKATSLALAFGGACGVEFDKETLLQNVLLEFKEQYLEFLKVQDLSFLRDAYNALLVNCNKEVRVLTPGQAYPGVALGINELGELLVKKEDGSVETVYAGEVSVRGIYGYV